MLCCTYTSSDKYKLNLYKRLDEAEHELISIKWYVKCVCKDDLRKLLISD